MFLLRIKKIVDYILREKNLALYFGDSQLRRNRIFNFIISNIYVGKYYEYDDINHLRFNIM